MGSKRMMWGVVWQRQSIDSVMGQDIVRLGYWVAETGAGMRLAWEGLNKRSKVEVFKSNEKGSRASITLVTL